MISCLTAFLLTVLLLESSSLGPPALPAHEAVLPNALGTAHRAVDASSPSRFSTDQTSTSPSIVARGASSKIVMSERVLGFRRSYRIYVPESSPPGPRPVLLALHGGIASAAIFERQSSFNQAAERHGFTVIYPNGIGLFGLLRHWNGGYCCAKAMRSNVDDVGFLDRVLEDASRLTNIDPARVYVVGFSNGGMLATLYASQRADRVAGVGIFASALGLENGSGDVVWQPDPPSRPVPMIWIHGTGDKRLPVDGRSGRSRRDTTTFGPVDSASAWANFNGCVENGHQERAPGSTITRWCYGSARSRQLSDKTVGRDRQLGSSQNEVESSPAQTSPVQRIPVQRIPVQRIPVQRRAVQLILLDNWIHEWPGPKLTSKLDSDHPLFGYDGAEVMWRFFTDR